MLCEPRARKDPRGRGGIALLCDLMAFFGSSSIWTGSNCVSWVCGLTVTLVSQAMTGSYCAGQQALTLELGNLSSHPTSTTSCCTTLAHLCNLLDEFPYL